MRFLFSSHFMHELILNAKGAGTRTTAEKKQISGQRGGGRVGGGTMEMIEKLAAHFNLANVKNRSQHPLWQMWQH